jgi:hypothetical protein
MENSGAGASLILSRNTTEPPEEFDVLFGEGILWPKRLRTYSRYYGIK